MPTCPNSLYCISNTGNNSINDNYVIQGAPYNSNSLYLGSTNGYYIYFSTRGYWCLSADFEVGECLLSGKKPCFSECPDFCDDYFSLGECPPPTPEPVGPCDLFDFDAIFDCEVPITPTPTPTNTPTQTITPTVSSTNFCPLYVDASIQSYTPSSTPTPTVTPTSSMTVIRDCPFSGNVTFMTIDSTIDCPYSVEFQDCYNGAKYYSAVEVVRPEGGAFTQFMVYQATVDGVTNRCISYVGVNVNIIGNNSITITSDLLGYSNLGDCLYCLNLRPTPSVSPSVTPTISLTPTITPTPSTSRTINYYLWENCADGSYICWPGTPFNGSWSIGTVFQTGSNDMDYPDTCWKLVNIGSQCSTNSIPLISVTTYTSNPFTNVIPVIKPNCLDCTVLDETRYFDPCVFIGTRMGNLYYMNTSTLELIQFETGLSNYGQLTLTNNKLFLGNNSKIKEYDVTFNPFSVSFVRDIDRPTNLSCSFAGTSVPIQLYSLFTPNGLDFYYLNIEVGSNISRVVKLTVNAGSSDTNFSCINLQQLFTEPPNVQFQNLGALVYTTTNRIIIRGTDLVSSNNVFYQYHLVGSTWTLELSVPISIPPSTSYRNLMVFNNKFRFSDTNTQEVFEMLPYPPYTVTSVGVYSGGLNPGESFFGVSQNSSCVNIHFTS